MEGCHVHSETGTSGWKAVTCTLKRILVDGRLSSVGTSGWKAVMHAVYRRKGKSQGRGGYGTSSHEDEPYYCISCDWARIIILVVYWPKVRRYQDRNVTHHNTHHVTHHNTSWKKTDACTLKLVGRKISYALWNVTVTCTLELHALVDRRLSHTLWNVTLVDRRLSHALWNFTHWWKKAVTCTLELHALVDRRLSHALWNFTRWWIEGCHMHSGTSHTGG